MRYVGHRARPGTVVGAPVVTAANADLALVREEAGYRPDKGRFAGPVRADDAQPTALLDSGRDA